MSNERGRTFGLVMVGFDLGIGFAGPMFGAYCRWLGLPGHLWLSRV
jgi:hypothetical protein